MQFGATLYYHALFFMMRFGASLYYHSSLYTMRLLVHHYISGITIYDAFWYGWPKVNFCIITSRDSVWCRG